MKKIVCVILSAFIILFVSSCSSGVSQEDYDRIVSENSSLKSQISNSEKQNNSSEKNNDIQKNSNLESSNNESNNIGTRKNPAQTGQPLVVRIDSISGGNAEIEITLNSVIRGQEAAKKIKSENQFNDNPPDGKEYVIAEFTVKNVKDHSGEDAAYDINNAQFNFSNSKFAKEDQMVLVSMDSFLNAELFEGADTTGYVVFISEIEDKCYAVYKDVAWFQLF